MVSLEEFKNRIDNTGECVSDKEMLFSRDTLYALAELAFEFRPTKKEKPIKESHEHN